jgi:hypothetical protein
MAEKLVYAWEVLIMTQALSLHAREAFTNPLSMLYNVAMAGHGVLRTEHHKSTGSA